MARFQQHAFLWLFVVSSPLFAQRPATIALTGATIRTRTDAGDFVGTIVIRDGKIIAIGPNVAVPAGIKSIDVTGCTITPGLIDAHGTLSLTSGAVNESGRDGTLNILDGVDPFSEDWRDAARQGITAVYIQPAGSGNLGGSGAVIRVGAANSVDELALRAVAGIQATLGIPPAAPAQPTTNLQEFLNRRGGPPIQLPQGPAAPPPPSTTVSRHAQYEQVRGLFTAAKQYGAEKQPKRDPAKELLSRAVKGEIPVRIEVYTEDDIRNAQKLIAEFGLQAALERVDRAKPLPDEIRTMRTSLVIGPLAGARMASEVRKLALDGRRLALGTFGADPRDTAGLRLHAAAAVSGGFPRDRVLGAVTNDAADLLGAGDKLGRLAVGRMADLAVFAGDPLDASVGVRLTISQGVVTHDDAKVELSRRQLTQSRKVSPMGPVDRVSSVVPVSTTEGVVEGATSLPDKLPASYVLKTSRLLNSVGQFVPGELCVVDGKLASTSGIDPALPVFDLGDTPISAGLVAGHLSFATETATDADAGHLRISDAVTPDDARFRAARDAGFLSAVAAPGPTNVIAGASAFVRGSESIDNGLKFVLTSTARVNERFPISLAGQIQLINARLFGDTADTDLYLPPAVRAGLLAERDRVLAAVRGRKLVAAFEVQTRAEILAALRLIRDHQLRGVLLMPRDVEDLADEIRQSGAAVVVGSIKPRDAERNVRGLVALANAGVPLAFAGDAAEMRSSAAWLANSGVPRAAIRRSLIGLPNEAFGVPATATRLQPGDAADFVVWTDDPLDPASRPLAVIVKGQRTAVAASDDGPDGGIRRPGAAPPRSGRRGR